MFRCMEEDKNIQITTAFKSVGELMPRTMDPE